MSPTTCPEVVVESSNDALHAFQAEIERLAHDADVILASSWGDAIPNTTTTTTGSEEEPTRNRPSDDDWSSGDEESVPCADDTLAKELQLLDALMNKDPAALSEQISKMLHDGKDDEPLRKDYFAQIQTTQEEEPVPVPSSIPQNEGDQQVGGAERDSAVTQGMSQLLRFAKESRDFGIDRALFVGDGLRVIDAGIHNGGAELIQFTGRIGTESRSVRTRNPLAKPQVLTRQQFQVMKRRGLQALLVRRSHRKKQVKVMKPFVVPFLDTTGTLSFIPRLVSYYEIEITDALSPPDHSRDESSPDAVQSSSNDVKESDQAARWDTPCIAIGLAGADFPMKDTMPGWKSRSFGYHSDDGTAWANKMKKSGYADKFGVGDVIGCGLDYRTGGTVFYTLNGKFLGHASTLNDEETGMDWYPSIGFDSHDCVRCHFGFDKPFVFDLLKYCRDEPPPPTSSTMEPVTDNKITHLSSSRRFLSYVLRYLLSGFQAPKLKD
jgi:hypothetical protein